MPVAGEEPSPGVDVDSLWEGAFEVGGVEGPILNVWSERFTALR
jgi:hypothetical protein